MDVSLGKKRQLLSKFILRAFAPNLFVSIYYYPVKKYKQDNNTLVFIVKLVTLSLLNDLE